MSRRRPPGRSGRPSACRRRRGAATGVIHDPRMEKGGSPPPERAGAGLALDPLGGLRRPHAAAARRRSRRRVRRRPPCRGRRRSRRRGSHRRRSRRRGCRRRTRRDGLPPPPPKLPPPKPPPVERTAVVARPWSTSMACWIISGSMPLIDITLTTRDESLARSSSVVTSAFTSSNNWSLHWTIRVFVLSSAATVRATCLGRPRASSGCCRPPPPIWNGKPVGCATDWDEGLVRVLAVHPLDGVLHVGRRGVLERLQDVRLDQGASPSPPRRGLRRASTGW